VNLAHDCERGAAGTSIPHRDAGKKGKYEPAIQHVAVLVEKFKQMSHKGDGTQPAIRHVAVLVEKFKQMSHKGDGTLAQHLVAQVHKRPWRRARKRQREEEEESTDGVALAKVEKKREMQRKIETSRHTGGTLRV
jgi:hypothetical protein